MIFGGVYVGRGSNPGLRALWASFVFLFCSGNWQQCLKGPGKQTQRVFKKVAAFQGEGSAWDREACVQEGRARD
jgi:hypothetical protein